MGDDEPLTTRDMTHEEVAMRAELRKERDTIDRERAKYDARTDQLLMMLGMALEMAAHPLMEVRR
jgi:hypothetical protein